MADDKPEGAPTYIIDVWDCWGDIVQSMRDATWEEVERLQEYYEDEPDKTVVFEEMPQ